VGSTGGAAQRMRESALGLLRALLARRSAAS
jgi:hypothetical protein